MFIYIVTQKTKIITNKNVHLLFNINYTSLFFIDVIFFKKIFDLFIEKGTCNIFIKHVN